MPTTTRGLWYPDSAAAVRPWEDFQQLAESVDAAIDDVAALTAAVTTGFTAATGFSVNAASYMLVGPEQVYLDVHINRTGASMSAASSSGNIPDTDLVTIPAAARPARTIYGSYSSSGVADGAFVLFASGLLQLQTLSPNAAIANGHLVHIFAAYPKSL